MVRPQKGYSLLTRKHQLTSNAVGVTTALKEEKYGGKWGSCSKASWK